MGSIGRMWWEGIRTGASVVAREPILGLKRLILPVSYWRSVEFAYVWRRLRLPPGSCVLDLGSPKDLALFLARSRGYEVIATDILESAVSLSDRYAGASGYRGKGTGRVWSEIQDGRALSYEDGTFDAAFTVSVLEHIPGDGDSQAIRELVRVVKPGGLVVVTTPFDTEHRDTYVQREVYEREFTGTPVFFERHYDEATLRSRLLEVNEAKLLDLEIWGEGSLRGERLLSRLGRFRSFASPFEAVLAKVLLRPVIDGVEGHPMASFFTLQRLE